MSNLYDNRSKKVEHGGLFVVPAVSAGQEIEMEKTVNAPYEALKVFGKSEQKAKWYQAEGVTTQVQEDGYNLLDCNVEWEPSAENQGISNIQSGVGSISFDYLHDHSNYPYIRTKGTMHLKPGIYTISGIASGDPLDSVGFSQGEPDGYRQVVGDCNGTITIETEGDYRFYVYPMGEDRLASYELTNLMVTEGDTSKTYQEYGYSKPSPAYPSELTSHISAGSYQIPTENGIYEVTLTEDLRGLDDTYRDFIRFDSVSGTGYLENNTQLVRLTRSNTNPYRNDSDVTYRLQGAAVLRDTIPKTNSSAPVFCNRLKRYHLTSELVANDIVGVSNYTESGMAYNNVYIFLSKSDIGITADDTDDTMKAKAYDYLDANPFYVVVHAYKTRVPLTFTKVESSTFPVLPWTAYGKQLIPFEPYETNSTGSTIKDWPSPPFVLGETYYFGGGVCDDGTAINSNNSALIILKDGTQVYNKSPNRAITITEDLLGADTIRLYTNTSIAGKIVTQFTGELGGSYSGSYEPFNPTPPESLTPSPDYPHQIYDLKDVTVTSRGKTLEEMGNPYDIYRCTYATIPLTLRSCGDDKDCLQNDGQAVNLYEYIKEVAIDGTLNNFVCNVVGSAGDPNCQFFVRNNVPTYDRLKQGSSVQNSHGFTAQAKSDSGNYLPYIIIPWSVLGLTSAPTTSEANEAAKSYCAEQNALGTPLIMRYVLYTPVETEITDAWAQDLIDLKTAPYWTKIYTDKETGGLEATYKHF